jgi:transcription elongation factor GreA-like protein
MKEEFEKLAAAGKIEGRHIEPLTQLVDGGCCSHRSWGFGKIKAVDTVFARFTIDFPGKAGHTMDLSFAANCSSRFRRTIFLHARPPTSRPSDRWPRIIWI